MEPDFVLPSINDLVVNQPRHQPSAAAIERVFSVAGFIVSSRRTWLGDETIEVFLFSHMNSDLRAFGGRVDEFVSCRKRNIKIVGSKNASKTLVGDHWEKYWGFVGMGLKMRIGNWARNGGGGF